MGPTEIAAIRTLAQLIDNIAKGVKIINQSRGITSCRNSNYVFSIEIEGNRSPNIAQNTLKNF